MSFTLHCPSCLSGSLKEIAAGPVFWCRECGAKNVRRKLLELIRLTPVEPPPVKVETLTSPMPNPLWEGWV